MKRRDFVRLGVGTAVGGAAGAIPLAHAQSGGVVDVNIVKIDGTPVRYSSAALPVKIAK